MHKVLIFLLGLILMIIGLTTIILYINLFSFGYTFKEYINYIIKIPEIYYMVIGFLFINISFFKIGGNNAKNI